MGTRTKILSIGVSTTLVIVLVWFFAWPWRKGPEPPFYRPLAVVIEGALLQLHGAWTMAAVSGDGRAPIDAEPLLGPDIDGWLRGRITYNRAVAGVHYKQIDKSVWIFRYVYDEDSIFVLKDAKCIRKARAQNLGENGVP